MVKKVFLAEASAPIKPQRFLSLVCLQINQIKDIKDDTDDPGCAKRVHIYLWLVRTLFEPHQDSHWR